MVFKTIIQRNIKLSEAPSFGEDIITYDATSRGARSYLSLGNEIIKKINNGKIKSKTSIRSGAFGYFK